MDPGILRCVILCIDADKNRKKKFLAAPSSCKLVYERGMGVKKCLDATEKI